MSQPHRDLGDALEAEDATRARALAASADGTDEVLALLADRASAGSTLALEVLLETLDDSGVVRRFVRAALLDRDAVDDVSQEALISVAASVGSFRGESSVTTWVHSIVRRRVVDHLRRRRADAPLPEDTGPLAHRMSSMIATRETVATTLAALPDLYREPVVLRDVEGLTYTEVADRLGRNLGTVKAQIARGRAMVAATLRDGEGWET